MDIDDGSTEKARRNEVGQKRDQKKKSLIEQINFKKNAQARNRTGGPTMATLDFTTKPLALRSSATGN